MEKFPRTINWKLGSLVLVYPFTVSDLLLVPSFFYCVWTQSGPCRWRNNPLDPKVSFAVTFRSSRGQLCWNPLWRNVSSVLLETQLLSINREDTFHVLGLSFLFAVFVFFFVIFFFFTFPYIRVIRLQHVHGMIEKAIDILWYVGASQSQVRPHAKGRCQEFFDEDKKMTRDLWPLCAVENDQGRFVLMCKGIVNFRVG